MHVGLVMECDYRQDRTQEEAFAEAFDIAWTVLHRHRLPAFGIPIPCFVETQA